MIKKLDILIVRAFISPFIATFFITVLVLIMQFFWLYIDDFVGKGLSAGIILEFIWYQSAVLVPLALPLAVLLSSLMTFGHLGETYELVAIKAAGISLLRFMQPLFFVVLLICGVAFLFSNYIIPVANLKSRTLLTDIVYAKPSFDIREGIFYDKISGFAIKIGKKEKNDSVIRNIIIYEQSSGVQDNFIIATDGVMRVSDNKRYLELVLRNGWRYQERSDYATANSEFIQLGFKEYKKQFDLSSFQFQRTADSVNKNNQRMLSMRQLSKAIDSIKKQTNQISKRLYTEGWSQLPFVQHLDSIKKESLKKQQVKTFDALIPDSLRFMVNQGAAGQISSLRVNNEIMLAQYKETKRNMRLHQIEWYRKITLSFACLVLFIIGAPLGSIIRKGGLGSPIIFSMVFFVIFYFLGTTGEKFAKEGAWSTFMGMWLSTFVLLPIGVFITYKALHDSVLFNKDFYLRFWKKNRSFRYLKKEPDV